MMLRTINIAGCVEDYNTGIMKVVLPRRLAAIVLLMALLGANAALASVCEVYCAGAVEKNVDHHHQSETGLSALHHHHPTAEHHNMAGCPACPKSAGLTSPHPRDCANEVQALQDNSRVFSDERPISQLDVAKLSTGSLPVPLESERFSPFHSPPKISSFEPILVSLRI